jgi:hypothetical protein
MVSRRQVANKLNIAERQPGAIAKTALSVVQPGCEHLIDSPPVEVDDLPAVRFDLVAYLWNSADRLRIFAPHFTDTNGTAEPGTIVVGKTPFQRSA